MIHSPYNCFPGRQALAVSSLQKRVFLRSAYLFLLISLLGFSFFVPPSVMAAEAPSLEKEEALEFSLDDFEQRFSLGNQTKDLCAWERDLGFFLSRERATESRVETIDCTERLQNTALREMKPEYQSGDSELKQEIQELAKGFPLEEMAGAIARYDREIAGLIVGIGKKESNWGKRTPKLLGEECYNYWGYRGVGTRGFTPDGYGCWEKPEEAVKTIGDRLVKLREIRLSAEPARMIVWKCGNSCAGHSDESVRKWIADVNFYFQEIARN